MPTWNSRGLRGSTLEELINVTNEYYREKNLALVQKIPTPITPTKFNPETRRIEEAFFEKDSTVDYIGVVQGIPICFDAKECVSDTFSLQNIHDHQFRFMTDYEKQGGIAFLIIMFTTRNDFYYMRYSELKIYIDRISEGHPKNFKYAELDDDFFLKGRGGALVPYLEGLSLDLNERDGD
ncbi:MAG: Holliday junction resolvase RecU [Eubacterium sp.]|nr:Holliday junction resolvase RecU [Eubacterium sp.]